ncbi:MAG: hypothetical protein R3Y21_01300 [Mycoplasmatota bacterium]
MLKKILGVLLIPIIYLFVFFVIRASEYFYFSYDLMLFVAIAIAFLECHIFLDIKKMYNFLFKNRYIVGIFIFMFLVIGEYNGSSLNFWNQYIQPNSNVEYSNNIIGISRGIRSDEWLVTTPHILSQTSENSNFSSVSNLLNAKETNVTMFPRLVIKDLTMIVYPSTLGYLFFNNEMAFSFNWYFNYFALFFVTLELFMIITKKNKLYSTLGAFLIAISPAVFWWNSATIILYGEAALLCIYYFINNKDIIKRILLSCALGIIASSYILCLYPAWQVPYGYVFVGLFIYLLVNQNEKIKVKDILYLIITAITALIILVPIFLNNMDAINTMVNTVYPGNRTSSEGGFFQMIFTYIGNPLYAYTDIANPCEFSQFYSLFPIPIIISIYLSFKKKFNDVFLNILNFIIIFYFLWTIVPIEFISKITLLSYTTIGRIAPVINYATVFVFIYILSKYETKNKIFNLKTFLYTIFATLSVLAISTYIHNEIFLNYFDLIKQLVSFVIFLPLFYLFILNNEKMNIILSILLIALSLFSCILIFPITKGYGVLAEKPLALEIQKIVKEDSDSIFAAVDSGTILQNYLIANGARTINSVNFVPNLELYYMLDPLLEYDGVYNRYAHVAIILTNEETSFNLNQTDTFTINLNYNDICLLEIDYLATLTELLENDKYFKIYEEDGSYIYKTICD